MIDVRRTNTRLHTKLDWLDSWHSFSFADHYDPQNTHFGLLLVHNDDNVAPGMGFGRHSHRDMEIVSWVLSGSLEHRDSIGTRDTIYPGLAERMSVGSGIRHSEENASPIEPVHFLQMWVPPDTAGVDPSYEQRDVSDRYDKGGLFALASGREPDAAITIHQPDATLWIARLDPGQSAELADAPFVHLFVARGSVDLETAGELAQGDAARLRDAGALRITAGTAGAECTVWETHAEVH